MRLRFACLALLSLALGAALHTPVTAQTEPELRRVVDAIRAKGCAVTEADLDRIFPDLKMPRKTVERALGVMIASDTLTRTGDAFQLSTATCSGAAMPPVADVALAAKLVTSEAAQRNHVQALFAANGCQMRYSDYIAYLDRKFPPAYTRDMTSDAAEARFMMELVILPMSQDGTLVATDNAEVLKSTGRGCR